MEITEEPIGARLLFKRKPIISCNRTTPTRIINSPAFLMENRFQILASCMEETPEKIVVKIKPFSMQFSVNSSGEYKSAWHEFSGHRTLQLNALWIEIDLSMFSSSDPFDCNRCYKRLLRFEKAKTNLRSL